jgi:aminoglycoside phosphotransferase (APT) family kinase protein
MLAQASICLTGCQLSNTPDLGSVPQRVTVTALQVRFLIEEQFPRWAGLPIQPVASGGWDNWTFRLGAGMLAFHGDVAEGNLLLSDGQLAAVIDFGTCGVGDPACDLAIAWTLLTAEGRQVFRERLSVGQAEWSRGCGWAPGLGGARRPEVASLPVFEMQGRTPELRAGY